jgi:hypothetical protein
MSSSFGMEFFLTPLLTTYLLLLKYETIRRTANASIYEFHATITWQGFYRYLSTAQTCDIAVRLSLNVLLLV